MKKFNKIKALLLAALLLSGIFHTVTTYASSGTYQYRSIEGRIDLKSRS